MSEQETTLLQEIKRRNILKVAAAYGVACWIILQLADVTFPAFGLDDGDIAYVIILLLVGFPAVLAFSWFYEITPDGLMPTRRVHPDESITHETGQRINHLMIALLSVALVFFMFEYFARDGQTTEPQSTSGTLPGILPGEQAGFSAEPGTLPKRATDRVVAADKKSEPSIAVMPFVNMSSDKENEYFSDGLSEELLNVLTQIGGLRVAGRTSSFYYKGKNKDLREIGSELDVNHILEGSVRKAGNRVRITAQLVSTDDGFHLWSDTYDRELDDIFRIQDEISKKVAEELQLTLLADDVTVADSRQTTSAEAHDVYLQATQLLYDRRPESILRSIDLFKLATRLDPEYAPPHIGLANAAMIAWNNHRSLSLLESKSIADEAFRRAEDMDYRGTNYWAAKGLYYRHLVALDPDNQGRSRYAFEKALELNPNNPDVLHWYATDMRSDPSASLARERKMMARAVKIDPHNRVIKMNYYLSMVGTEEEERGIGALQRLAREDSDYDGFSQYLAIYYLTRSRFLEAAKYIGQLHDDNRVKFLWLRWIAEEFRGRQAANELASLVPKQHVAYEDLRLLSIASSGDRQQMVAEAKILLEDTDYENHAANLAFGLIEQGEYQLAVDIMENANRGLALEIPSHLGMDPPTPRQYLAATYLAGQTERARRFAQKLLDVYKDEPLLGFPRGRGLMFADAHMVLGNHEAALDELEAACEQGWLLLKSFGVATNPLFDPIRDHPRYVALTKSIERDMDALRPQVYAMLDWHPVFAQLP